jgi:hypothetical protein
MPYRPGTAITHLRGAGRLLEPHSATILLKEAMSSNDLALITTAVSMWERILTATPASHPDRATFLSNLGVALRARFQQLGTLADLDEASMQGELPGATSSSAAVRARVPTQPVPWWLSGSIWRSHTVPVRSA